MESQPRDDLVRSPSDAYGETFTADLLEQYKLYVGSAEQVSARRIASSRLLLALNAGFVALYGIEPAGFGQSWWAMPVPLLGIVRVFAVVANHQVPQGSQPSEVHAHPRVRAALAGSTVHVRVAACRTGTGTTVSCRNRNRAMDSVDVPSPAHRSAGRAGAGSGDSPAPAAGAIASLRTVGR